MLLALVLFSCSQEKKLIRKASNAVERSDFDKAIMYYDQVLAKDSNSFLANAGKGIVLSEYVGNYEKAIPCLEKAAAKSPKDTKPKLNGDLGKSYHFIGNYPRALYYYGKVEPYNKEKFSDYDVFLNKRIADCKYAMEHPEVAPADKEAVTNIGNTINTPMPEYGPIFVDGHLIFTSKRQDTPKEKKNGLDGRYFEAIYTSSMNKNGTFSEPKRYKLAEPALQIRNYGESIVSVSHDGSKIYVYKGGKIYETALNDSTHTPDKLSKTINFSNVQNHACLASDGKTLFFTSESEKEGRGGSDIYKSIRNEDGTWSQPQIMDYAINTAFDEEAPYINENGTLFFASNGLPGYGGFDIYKTHMENGKWTTPENLGQPINSPGDDIYFVLNNNSSNGYYSSARPGGYGDMDIYKVVYASAENPECQPNDNLLVINAIADTSNQMTYNMSLQIPDQYKTNVRSYNWTLNGEQLAQTTDKFQYNFKSANTYTLSAKIIAYCDTCPALIGMCTEKIIVIENNIMVYNDTVAKTPAVDAKALAKSKRNKKNPANVNATPGTMNNSYNSESFLSDSQLKAMNWNTSAQGFEFNQSTITESTKAILDQNISIMKNNANLRVVINGYADSRGSEAYNKNLSIQRANAVKAYMINNGIAKNKIKAVNGYGETNLLNNCSDGVECTEEQHGINRRVKVDVYENVKIPTTITLND